MNARNGSGHDTIIDSAPSEEWLYRNAPDLRRPELRKPQTIMPEKKPKLLTPVGEARWAHVHTPAAPYKDPKTGKTKGGPSYRIDVVFDPEDPKWKAWAAKITEAVRALPVEKDDEGNAMKKHFPFKPEKDKDKNKTGKFVAQFKTSDKFKPGVFDKHGRPIPPETLIGNSSKVVANYCENTYDAFGGGMNLYLNAVQVIELVEYGQYSAESYGFETEEFDGIEALNAGEATGQAVKEAVDDLPF